MLIVNYNTSDTSLMILAETVQPVQPMRMEAHLVSRCAQCTNFEIDRLPQHGRVLVCQGSRSTVPKTRPITLAQSQIRVDSDHFTLRAYPHLW